MTEGRIHARWRALRTGRRVAKGIGGLVTFLATVVALLLGLGVIHPFGGDDDPLAAAVEQAREAGSAFIDLRREFRVGEQDVRQHGEGAFAFDSREGILDLRVAGNLGEPDLRFVFSGPSVYVFGYVPDRPIWCQYHLQSSGRLFGALAGFSDDPAQALVNLREYGEAENVGEEELFGDSSAHYRGSLDLRELRDDSTESVRQRLGAFIEASGSTLPIDVWIGDDDLVRRIRTTFEVPARELGLQMEGGISIMFTVDFSQYGVDVRAEPPPVELTSYAGSNGCPANFQ